MHSALDLCLSCKGCARDCPTGIDMAAYKSEVLTRPTGAGSARAVHYALGWLPRWARLITRHPALARLVNLTTGRPDCAASCAGRPASTSAGRCPGSPSGRPGGGSRCRRSRGEPVVIWVDSFSDSFAGGGVEAVVDVLAAPATRRGSWTGPPAAD